jgi:hypothetical protein
MRIRYLLPLFLFLVAPVVGQVEHAPTPEQCKADADAWDVPKASPLFQNQDQFNALTARIMRNPNVTAKELNARNKELGECVKTDSTFAVRYAEANRAYALAELGRMADYMQRHNLMSQFYDEDGQGKR